MTVEPRLKSWWEDAHGEVVLLSDATDAIEEARAAALREVAEFLDNEGTGWKPDALWAFGRVRSYIAGQLAILTEATGTSATRAVGAPE